MTHKEAVKELYKFFNKLEAAFDGSPNNQYLVEPTRRLANKMWLLNHYKEDALEEKEEARLIKSSLEELLKAFE